MRFVTLFGIIKCLGCNIWCRPRERNTTARKTAKTIWNEGSKVYHLWCYIRIADDRWIAVYKSFGLQSGWLKVQSFEGLVVQCPLGKQSRIIICIGRGYTLVCGSIKSWPYSNGSNPFSSGEDVIALLVL